MYCYSVWLQNIKIPRIFMAVYAEHQSKYLLRISKSFYPLNLCNTVETLLLCERKIEYEKNNSSLVHKKEHLLPDYYLRYSPRSYRNMCRSRSLRGASGVRYPRVQLDYALSQPGHYLPATPSFQWQYHAPEEEILLGPACWLWDYLRRSGQGGFFLPLSGKVPCKMCVL